MFRAARALRITGPKPPLAMHNSERHFTVTDQGKADIIQEWFKEQFTDPDNEPLHPFTGDPRPLQSPVKEAEVKKVLKVLNNRRASGPDGINSDLLKYASDVISKPITHIINSVFEKHLPIKAVGQGTLVTLPKPRKPPGPPVNLRQTVLLNSIQKILSNVTSCQIQKKIEKIHWSLPEWL